ncbi:mRNA-decapping enzyme subunit 2 [Globomyces sp. JEL0801]|nr:mRNA-decapping enzyme subunit 2 [Globomyces sp. JEL0801]
MSFENLTMNEVLEDLSSRFIINVPNEELKSIQRVCFQIEQAHWYYEDFVRETNPKFHSTSLKTFALMMLRSCPLLRHWCNDFDNAFSTFMDYKVRVPVCGAILLNSELNKVLMVRGWKASAGWGFPKGKINQDESETSCAIREVFEEIGFDCSPYFREYEFVERVINGQKVRLFIISGIDENIQFATQTRKEIGDIKWHSIHSLPGYNNSDLDETSKYAVYTNNKKHKFYMVTPFIPALRKWIKKFKRAKQQGKARSRAKINVQMDHIVADSDDEDDSAVPNTNYGYSNDYVNAMVPENEQVHLEQSLKKLLGLRIEDKSNHNGPFYQKDGNNNVNYQPDPINHSSYQQEAVNHSNYHQLSVNHVDQNIHQANNTSPFIRPGIMQPNSVRYPQMIPPEYSYPPMPGSYQNIVQTYSGMPPMQIQSNYSQPNQYANQSYPAVSTHPVDSVSQIPPNIINTPSEQIEMQQQQKPNDQSVANQNSLLSILKGNDLDSANKTLDFESFEESPQNIKAESSQVESNKNQLLDILQGPKPKSPMKEAKKPKKKKGNSKEKETNEYGKIRILNRQDKEEKVAVPKKPSPISTDDSSVLLSIKPHSNSAQVKGEGLLKLLVHGSPTSSKSNALISPDKGLEQVLKGLMPQRLNSIPKISTDFENGVPPPLPESTSLLDILKGTPAPPSRSQTRLTVDQERSKQGKDKTMLLDLLLQPKPKPVSPTKTKTESLLEILQGPIIKGDVSEDEYQGYVDDGDLDGDESTDMDAKKTKTHQADLLNLLLRKT